MALWFLMIIVVPIAIVGSLALNAIDDTVTKDTERELLDLLASETARVNDVVAQFEIRAVALAEDQELRAALGPRLATAQVAQDVRSVAESLVAASLRAGLPVEGMQVYRLDGTRLTRTLNAAWEAPNSANLLEAVDSRRSLVVEAFDAPGAVRVAAITPIMGIDDRVLGALVVELGADLLLNTRARTHSSLETRETNLIQRSGGGLTQMLGPRRFDAERDDFNEVPPFGPRSVNEIAFASEGAQITHGTDYRSVEVVAAVDRVSAPGWAVVVKIDTAEAFELRSEVRRVGLLTLLVAIVGATLGWLFIVRPLGRRLARMSAAAEQIAGGDYESPIGDDSTDEIGQVAQSIDRLAQDLDEDIKARVAIEGRLRWQANHDTLTGLANRQAARQRLAENDAKKRPYGLLFADLDGFKVINELHGHLVGDEVLQIVAQRMRSVVPVEDGMVVRWGGDEFLLIVTAEDEVEMSEIRTLVSSAFTSPVRTSAASHHVSATIGSKLVTTPITAQQALRDVDADMFHSKVDRSAHRKVPAAAIRLVEDALAEDRVEAFFQPVVNSELTGAPTLSGVEALMRIRDRDGSVIPPARFLPDLGSHPLAAALDFRILDQSLAHIEPWLSDGFVDEGFHLAVNLGNAAMANPRCADSVIELLTRHQIPPGMLVVEIPESVESPPVELLTRLRNHGVLLAVDDVGCQHSNLERLVDVAAHVAKIDRRWIPDVNDPTDGAFMLIAGLIEQCQMLSFQVIAEGIETQTQREILISLGVNMLQGYLFGKPVPPAQIAKNWFEFEQLTVRSAPN